MLQNILEAPDKSQNGIDRWSNAQYPFSNRNLKI